MTHWESQPVTYLQGKAGAGEEAVVFVVYLAAV